MSADAMKFGLAVGEEILVCERREPQPGERAIDYRTADGTIAHAVVIGPYRPEKPVA